jgi:flagellar protein FliS
MYQTSTYFKSSNHTNTYLAKEILEATPQKLLIKVYDFAIANCKRGNMTKTNRAISELINALNFEDKRAKEISTGLIKLYQFCQEEMRKNNTDIVYKILTDLRETWITIFNRPRVE